MSDYVKQLERQKAQFEGLASIIGTNTSQLPPSETPCGHNEITKELCDALAELCGLLILNETEEEAQKEVLHKELEAHTNHLNRFIKELKK